MQRNHVGVVGRALKSGSSTDKRPARRFIAPEKIAAACAVALGAFLPASADAASGTWTQTVTGGNWNDIANWSGGTVADGTGALASFNTLDITADNTVHLDSPRTISNLTFGDTDTSTAAGWLLDDNAVSGNVLTLAGTTTNVPSTNTNRVITVNSLGTGKVATISAAITGTVAFTTNYDIGLQKEGLGTLSLTGANTYEGSTNVHQGVLTLSGTSATLGSTTYNHRLSVGFADGAAAFRQSGGTVSLGSDQGQLFVGFSSPLTTPVYGAYEMSGGTLQASSPDTGPNFRIAIRSGQFTQTGGNINVSYTGGAAPLTTNSRFSIGSNNSVNGRSVFYSTGGTTTISTLNKTGSALMVGAHGGVAELTIGGTADWTLSGNAAGVQFGIDSATGSSSGMINLIGTGRLTTSGITKPDVDSSGYLNFNGGTLRAAAGNASFLTGITAARVFSGGGTIDTQNFDITIAQPLVTPANNMVTTIPVTNGGSGYVGAPLLTITGTGGTGATAVANYDAATGSITSVTITSPGSGFSGVPTVTAFGGGGTGLTFGTVTTAAATTGTLTKTGVGKLTLSGSNTYGATLISAGTLEIGIGGTTGTLGTGAVTNNGSLIFNRSNALSVANTITGSGSVTVAGTINGNISLGGPNTFNGGLTIKSGTATANVSNVGTTSGAAGPSTVPITLGASAANGGNNATLIVDGPSSTVVTLTNNINLASNANGTLTVRSNDVGGTLGGTSIALNGNNLTFATNDGANFAIANGITGSGNVITSYLRSSDTTNGNMTHNFTGLVNNTGKIENAGLNHNFGTSGTGNAVATRFTGGIGSNVNEIIQTNNKTNLIVTGGLAVNALGTTISNNSTTEAGAVGGGTRFIYVSGNISGTGALTLNNNAGLSANAAVTKSDSGFIEIDSAAGVTLTGGVNNDGLITNSGSGSGNTLITGIIGTNVDGVVQNSNSSALTLGGANTYTTNTTIKKGTLALLHAGTIASSAVITVGDGTSTNLEPVPTLDLTNKASFAFGSTQTLKGKGTVNIGAGKTVTVNGTLAPGASAGQLNVTGNLTLNTGSIEQYEFQADASGGTAGTDYDLTAVSGGLTITDGDVYLYQEGTTNTYSTNGIYTLFTYGGAFSGNVNNLSVANTAPTKTYTFADTGSAVTLMIAGGNEVKLVASGAVGPTKGNMTVDGNPVTNNYVIDEEQIEVGANNGLTGSVTVSGDLADSADGPVYVLLDINGDGDSSSTDTSLATYLNELPGKTYEAYTILTDNNDVLAAYQSGVAGDYDVVLRFASNPAALGSFQLDYDLTTISGVTSLSYVGIVPEPSTIAVLGVGALGVFASRRRRRSA